VVAPPVPPVPDELFWSTIVPVTGKIVGFGVKVSELPETQYE
jgi:hypothetical protein